MNDRVRYRKALVLAALLLLPLSAQGTEHMPLPKNLQVVPPDPTIPPEAAVFSGWWVGKWQGVLDATLVVTKIQPAKRGGYEAEVVYSWGTYAPWYITRPGFREYDGDIKAGKLVIRYGLLIVTYQLTDDGTGLIATWDYRGRQTSGLFTKVTEK